MLVADARFRVAAAERVSADSGGRYIRARLLIGEAGPVGGVLSPLGRGIASRSAEALVVRGRMAARVVVPEFALVEIADTAVQRGIVCVEVIDIYIVALGVEA